MMPWVRPQRSSGRSRLLEAAWSPETSSVAICFEYDSTLLGTSGIKSLTELQYTLSDGIRRTAAKSICPRANRRHTLRISPPRRDKRSDTSQRSNVRKDGASKARKETQWAELISVGCNRNGGRSNLVTMKTKGHSTIKGIFPQAVVTTRSGRLPTNWQCC